MLIDRNSRVLIERYEGSLGITDNNSRSLIGFSTLKNICSLMKPEMEVCVDVLVFGVCFIRVVPEYIQS